MLAHQLHHGNVMFGLLNATSNGIIATALVFIACELGQRLGDALEEIDTTVERFDWYLFPIEIKRMLPMIIANAQNAVKLECFGSIHCTRELFKNVRTCLYNSKMKEVALNNDHSNWCNSSHDIDLNFFRPSIIRFHILWCCVKLSIERSHTNGVEEINNLLSFSESLFYLSIVDLFFIIQQIFFIGSKSLFC